MRLAARLMAIVFTASLLLPALIAGPVFADAADHFSVIVSPGLGTAGDPFNLTVTALDNAEATDTGYAGTVHFTSTDAGSSTVLPANYTFVGGDNGEHTFVGVVLTTVGNQTITATDGPITGTSSAVAIDPGTASQLVVEAYPDPTTAGVLHSVLVAAEDDFGNIATGYAGLVTVTASGGTTHVAPSAATALSSGVGSFDITFDTAGAGRSISTTGTLGVTPDSQSGINVAPAAASHLVMTGYPDPTAAGVAHTVTVSALDAFNNLDTNYGGTVTVTASGGTTHISPPGATPLTSGAENFDVTFDTVGTGRSVTATGTLGVGLVTQSGINVDPAAADHLVLSAYPDPTVAGAGHTVTVTATDQFGNTDVNYAGSVTVTATGGTTHVSPVGPQTLTNGVRTFTVTFDTVGSSRSIDVTGTLGVSADTQGAIDVTPAAATVLVLGVYPDPTVAGASHAVSVTAKDPFGNTDTNYAGLVTVTASGGTTHVSPSAATALVNGVGSFDVTFDTVGLGRSILASGTGGVSPDSQLAINVDPAAADHLVLGVYPDPTVAGAVHAVTVTATDQFGNTDTNYAGLVTVIASGGTTHVSPSAATALTSGVGSFNVTFDTAGSGRSISVSGTDGVASDSQTLIDVNPGTATHLVLGSYPDPTTAGVLHAVTVTAEDAFNNVATGYAGFVTVTASGGTTHVSPSAATALTSGTGSFNVTFDTAGSGRSITATGTVGVTLANQLGINVDPAAATHLVMSSFPDPTVAGDPHTVTVVATDAFGNTDTNYAGLVTVAAVGGTTQVSPPGATLLTSGSGNFNVTFDTVGASRSITATGTGVTLDSQSGINVDPAAADHLVLSAYPSTTTAGVSHTVTVTATDPYGNTDTSYAGSVTVTATGGTTHVSPAGATTLTSGVRTFTITFDTAGSGRQIDVVGTLSVSSDSQTGITVDPAAATHLVLGNYPDPTTAGVLHSVSVTALDQFDNVDTNYGGVVTVVATGGVTHVSPSVATALSSGVGSFDVTFDTAGSARTITATGTVGVTQDSQSLIDVTPAAASQLVLGVYPDPTVAGALHAVTVTAEDPFGNTDTNYAGLVTVTASGGTTHVAPSAATALSGGTGSFNVTFDTAGSGRSIIASGTVGVSPDSQTLIDVNAAALDHIVLSPPTATVDPGVDQAFTVEQFDVFNNSRGDATPTAVLTIDGGGTCDNVLSTCQALSSGAHTVTATYLTKVDTGTLTINNLDPDAVDDTTIFVNEDASATPIDVLNNDSDPNGDALTVTGITQGSIGTVAISLDNLSVTYTPDPGNSGPDSFTYTIDDGHGGTDIATVTLTVVSINDAPTFTLGADPSALEDAGLVTVPGFAVGNPGSPFESSQTLTYVVTGDTDPALFTALGEPAIDGTTGDLTFTSAPDMNGTATITVHVVDSGPNGGGDVNFSPPQTFIVTVTAVDDAPVAVNDPSGITPYQVKQGTATTFPALTGVLANDTDIDSLHSALTALLDTQPTHGTVTLNLDGSFTYTPTGVYVGTDSFTYHAHDATSDSNIATVNINVYINHAPTAVGDIVTVVSGSPYTPLAVLTNDNAVNPDPGEILHITHVSNPPHGSASITGGGAGLSYRPDANFIGTDLFSYTISDGVFTSTATVLVHVPKDTYKPVATAPVQTIRAQTLGSTTVTVYLSWTGTDKGYGISTFEVWQSVNGHTYTKVKTTSGHSMTFTASVGTTYRFRVRAIDKKGNVGAYATGPSFKPYLYQETAASYSTPWTVANSSVYSGGHDRFTTAIGESATFTSTGRTFSWVSAKGSMRSTASVFVDGVLKANVNLAATSSLYKYVAYSITFATSGSHSIQVVYTGPAGTKRVDVDAFVVLR